VAARRYSENTIFEAALGWAPSRRVLGSLERANRWIYGDFLKKAR